MTIRALDHRGRPCGLKLRERTTVEKKRADLPARAPFEKMIHLVNREGREIQVFGFDLAALPKSQRAQDQFLGAVEIVNQELFVNDEEAPFAILTWRRSDRDIVIIQSKARPDATPTELRQRSGPQP